MNGTGNNDNIEIPRATGLLVIVVENSNPNGDPDQESDPRRRNHDNRGMITGVSFKRKPRDLVLRKDEVVWPKVASSLGIVAANGKWVKGDLEFDILERRDIARSDVNQLLSNQFDAFKKRYWDARVFGNTFLEEGGPDTIRSGIAHFSLAVSVAPVRVHRLTKTKTAPAQSGRDGAQGPSRGMAPLAHRVVEHAVYTMPFFINPTGAKGKRGTGCTALDIALLLKLIPFAYPHTKSDIRPLVEVRHAWYAEHENELGSFSEFDFIERLTPKRLGGDRDKPSVSGIPLGEQYNIPTQLGNEMDPFPGKFKDGKLYDLCVELPPWCDKFKEGPMHGE
ncbi:type I CRISPR-associated protein Cas7 [Syntrophorhabdus aromaticivorans]|uniref:Type I CRISPR-associated protein Cas7 n=1 Tax=Syntrophorhabdus aromaticivorans TaxID=328301 RepID=A0A971M6Y0_9BACT|nr:type I CRISPR-associated protein Cas7 [Syntrophorhabdus aromaticivorans]NLW36899.1 type I CRISPR-associated protein Cas7 [Syntrophorhabdus aromaticivorans]